MQYNMAAGLLSRGLEFHGVKRSVALSLSGHVSQYRSFDDGFNRVKRNLSECSRLEPGLRCHCSHQVTATDYPQVEVKHDASLNRSEEAQP